MFQIMQDMYFIGQDTFQWHFKDKYIIAHDKISDNARYRSSWPKYISKHGYLQKYHCR